MRKMVAAGLAVPIALGAPAAIIAESILDAAPADAGTGPLYPSGCQTWANGSWGNNCWVGTSYKTAANYVTGVELFETEYGRYSGPIDGTWGTSIYNGVYGMQHELGLTADGVWGSSTASYVQSYRLATVYSAGNYNYKCAGLAGNPGTGTPIFAGDHVNSPYYWWTLNKAVSSWVHDSTDGPE